ncbi:MAG: hypothetical protein MSH11_04695 [Ruminococcus sp.]|nr:hypothetical protein [Ruminococcus sp.]
MKELCNRLHLTQLQLKIINGEKVNISPKNRKKATKLIIKKFNKYYGNEG